jgi:hypothetical protein
MASHVPERGRDALSHSRETAGDHACIIAQPPP